MHTIPGVGSKSQFHLGDGSIPDLLHFKADQVSNILYLPERWTETHPTCFLKSHKRLKSGRDRLLKCVLLSVSLLLM